MAAADRESNAMKQLAEREQELAQAQDKLSELEPLRGKQLELERLRTEHEMVRRELGDAVGRASSLDAKLAEATARTHKLEKVLIRFATHSRASLSSLRAQSESVRSFVGKELTKAFEALTMSQIGERVATAEAQRRHGRDQLDSVAAALSEQKASNDALSSRLREANEQCECVIANTDWLVTGMCTLIGGDIQKSPLVAAISGSRGFADSLNSFQQEAQRHILARVSDAVEAARADLTEKHGAVKQELSNKLSEASDAVQTAQEKAAGLETQVTTLSAHVEEATSREQRLQAEVSALTTQVEIARTESTQPLRRQFREMYDEVEALQKKFTSELTRRERQVETAMKERLQAAEVALTSQRTEMEQRMTSLKRELADAKQAEDAAKTSTSHELDQFKINSQRRVSQLEADMHELKQEKRKVESQLEASRREQARLLEDLDSQRAENRSLNASMARDKAAAERERYAREEELEQVQKQKDEEVSKLLSSLANFRSGGPSESLREAESLDAATARITRRVQGLMADRSEALSI